MNQASELFSLATAARLGIEAWRRRPGPLLALTLVVLPVEVLLYWQWQLADEPGIANWAVRLGVDVGFIGLSGLFGAAVMASAVATLRDEPAGTDAAIGRAFGAFWTIILIGLAVQAPALTLDHWMVRPPAVTPTPMPLEAALLWSVSDPLLSVWEVFVPFVLGLPVLAALDRRLGPVEALRQGFALVGGLRWRWLWILIAIEAWDWFGNWTADGLANLQPVDEESLAYAAVAQGVYSLSFLPVSLVLVGAYLAMTKAAGARDSEGAAATFD